jgi:hypothetical protein
VTTGPATVQPTSRPPFASTSRPPGHETSRASTRTATATRTHASPTTEKSGHAPYPGSPQRHTSSPQRHTSRPAAADRKRQGPPSPIPPGAAAARRLAVGGGAARGGCGAAPTLDGRPVGPTGRISGAAAQRHPPARPGRSGQPDIGPAGTVGCEFRGGTQHRCGTAVPRRARRRRRLPAGPDRAGGSGPGVAASGRADPGRGHRRNCGRGQVAAKARQTRAAMDDKHRLMEEAVAATRRPPTATTTGTDCARGVHAWRALTGPVGALCHAAAVCGWSGRFGYGPNGSGSPSSRAAQSVRNPRLILI